MEGARVPQLACRNAYGEHLLEPGRVNDCYLAILLNQPLADIAPEPGRCSCRFRRAAARGDPPVRRPVLCDLVTGYPDRQPGGLVFLADLTDELRAGPQQTWTVVGISPEAAPCWPSWDCWRYAHVKGCTWAAERRGGPRARPARMTYVREQLRVRRRQISRQYPALAAPDQPSPAGRELPVADYHSTPPGER